MTTSARKTDNPRASVFVVIAAMNEATQIEEVVRGVRERYPNVVVVDDGSADSTQAAAARGGARTLRHAINRGQGAALQTGIEYALAKGAEIIVTFDGDGQHSPEDIDALVEPIQAGECDVTLGSRFLGDAIALPKSRRLMLRMAVLFTRVVNRLPVTDTHNGLRAFSRAAADRVHISADGMAHASQLLDIVRREGWRYREVPVHIRYTAYSLEKGQSIGRAFEIAFRYLLGRLLP